MLYTAESLYYPGVLALVGPRGSRARRDGPADALDQGQPSDQGLEAGHRSRERSGSVLVRWYILFYSHLPSAHDSAFILVISGNLVRPTPYIYLRRVHKPPAPSAGASSGIWLLPFHCSPRAPSARLLSRSNDLYESCTLINRRNLEGGRNQFCTLSSTLYQYPNELPLNVLFV